MQPVAQFNGLQLGKQVDGAHVGAHGAAPQAVFPPDPVGPQLEGVHGPQQQQQNQQQQQLQQQQNGFRQQTKQQNGFKQHNVGPQNAHEIQQIRQVMPHPPP